MTLLRTVLVVAVMQVLVLYSFKKMLLVHPSTLV